MVGSAVITASEPGLSKEEVPVETRHERRRRRHRDAILLAAGELMGEKGPDSTTMQEISDRSDLALATIYSYFDSKDQIVLAVVEDTMNRLGLRIRAVTSTFTDPAQTFAFGIRCLMQSARRDRAWHFLLKRPGVMAETMVKVFGRYGKSDIRRASTAGRYKVNDVNLVWRQAMWAVVGVCIAVHEATMGEDEAERLYDEAVANVLGMVGVERGLAEDIVRRPRPLLPDE